MMEGFTLDISNGARLASSWVAGKPEKSFLGSVKIGEKEQHPIQTFRCTKCGYLELYARES